ncbi:ABC transporter permease [Kitasatospora sp. NBC_01250]|uniref:ABC transporter permease n=1 Tax=Kitasatospora sp. NBC_01250 TaxID=2903571 RepID=UPI002E36E97B|nr:ABC transporter permease [Kitasatospora sp. NBC_01250]
MTTQSDLPVPPARAGATDGVIHNIGYRGYQGPRLGRSYATRSLFVQGLRGAFGLGRSAKSKVLPMLMLAAATLPAAMVVVLALVRKSDQLSTDYPQYLSNIGLLFFEIFVAAQAPVLLSRDLRHLTVPLYFSRPITRGDYVRAKCAAMVAATLVIMVLPLLVLYVGALLGGMDFTRNTVHFGIGLLAAVLYSLVFSAIGLVIAATTPRRGFGVAAIMGVLLVSEAVASVLASLHGDPTSGSSAWAYVLGPSSLVERFVNRVFSLAPDLPTTPGAAGAVVFGLEIVVLVAGAYALLLRRYRKV